MAQLVAEVTRGGLVESIHRGDMAVVDSRGNVIYSLGDPHKVTFWRSAAKPFQVLPLVEDGGVERFSLAAPELALMTSSHGGEPRHVDTAISILNKLGHTPDVLECGAAPPMSQRAANALLKRGEQFSPLTNACSGKHCNMIALSMMREYDISGYAHPTHPVQADLFRAVSDLTGLMPKDIHLGIDGCGVPVYALPLYNMAIAYAHLSKPDAFPGPRQNALRTIAAAMTTHPYFVAGTNRLDTLLMEVTEGRILAKLGAEGVYCLSAMDEGIGLALKIEDGNTRAIDPVIIQTLHRLALLKPEEMEKLAERRMPVVRNHRGETVGTIRAVCN